MKQLPSNVEIRNNSEYERDHFDHFLKKVGFSFSVPSIHIAGTNGKGSVANYLFNIYKKAGYKVGIYTSPYYSQFNEIIKVDDKNITDDEINEILNEELKLINKCSLSLYEILTYVALTYFKKQNCDLVIVECLMGGLIDATNVFESTCSVITTISLEHTAILGKTLSEIAYQKSGIIADESRVVLGNIPEEAMETIMDICLTKKCRVFNITEPGNIEEDESGYSFSYEKLTNIKVNCLAFYSITNAIIAIETINAMQDLFNVSQIDIIEGIKNTKLSLRLETLPNDKLTLIDGAHNPEAMHRLNEAMLKRNSGKNIHALFACFKDKNLPLLLNELGEISHSITITTFDHPRARKYEDYFLYADEYEFISNPIDAYKMLKEKYPEDLILITGSIAFAAYMFEVLK